LAPDCAHGTPPVCDELLAALSQPHSISGRCTCIVLYVMLNAMRSMEQRHTRVLRDETSESYLAWPHLCEHSEQQRADLQTGIICLRQGNIGKLSVRLSQGKLQATLHTFSLSICGSGGGTTIWLAGCVGTGAIRGAAGAGAGGSVSRASLGGRSLMGPSRIG